MHVLESLFQNAGHAVVTWRCSRVIYPTGLFRGNVTCRAQRALLGYFRLCQFRISQVPEVARAAAKLDHRFFRCKFSYYQDKKRREEKRREEKIMEEEKCEQSEREEGRTGGCMLIVLHQVLW